MNQKPISIRIGSQAHEDLKKVANNQGSKLTDLLAEMAFLLVKSQLSPSQIAAKLEAASEMQSFQNLLTEQIAKVLKVVGQQERNYLFPLAKELALLQARMGEVATTEENIWRLKEIDERLAHVEALLQANKETLEKQYQLLMEV